MAIHDAKLLSENLIANEDWEKAGNAYAVQHDRDFGIIHTFENWMSEVLCQTGPDADKRGRDEDHPRLLNGPKQHRAGHHEQHAGNDGKVPGISIQEWAGK